MAKQIVNLSDTVKTFQEKVNIISADVGWRGNMTTTVDSDIVGGINELDSDIGARPHTNLTTDAKTLTGAANELDGRLDSANNTQINSAKLHMRDSSATNTIKGRLDVHSNVDIGGNLQVDGSLTVDGVVTFKAGTSGTVALGDDSADNIDFNADVVSNIIPGTTNTFNLGSAAQQWKNIHIDGVGYIDDVQADTATLGSAKVSDLTNNRVVIVGTSGELEDDANFTFDGTTFNLNGNVDVGSGLDVTGNITVTGTVDGRDIAADGTLLDTHDNELGTITALAMGTTASTVSGAILELETEIDTLNTKVEPSRAFSAAFTATTVMAALNELKTQADLLDSGSGVQINQIGDLASLDTTAKNNLVAAINELDDRIDTDADFRNKVSATDAGGDGSFAYNQGTGVFTYTGPSASEVRAHFSGGTDIGISSGTINHDAISSTTSTATAATPGYGDSFTYVNGITVSNQGHVTDVETKQITLPAIYSLPEATASVRGGIELFSNTSQSVAANAVTATASRTYGIQLNSSGQAVVNVPWVDTNTDTNTTYSAGKDLDLSGTTFDIEPTLNHVNAITTATDTSFFLTTSGTGDILLVAGGDNVYMRGTTSGEELNFYLSTGTQEISASDTLKLEASTGNIILDALVGDIYLTAASDNVTMRGTTSNEQIDFDLGTTQQSITASDTLKVIAGNGDLYLEAEGNTTYANTDNFRISKTDGGTFSFLTDTTPEIDVTGAFTIDCNNSITLDAGTDIILNASGHVTGNRSVMFGAETELDISSAANSTSLVIYNSAGTAVKTIYGTTG